MTKLVWVLAGAIGCALGCGSKSNEQEAKAKSSPTNPVAATETKPPTRRTNKQPVASRGKRRSELPKKYWQLLREGRQQSHDGHYRSAILTFDKGLSVVPDDARLLVELSWAAFQGKQLDRAKQAANKALAVATRDSIKAQALYNLGRVYHSQGKKDDALRALYRSQVLRPHRVVARWIKDLAGKSPPMIVTPLPAAPATGSPARNPDDWWGVELAKPRTPFQAAFVQENDRANCDLFMKVAIAGKARWFVAHKVADCPGNNKYWRTVASLAMTTSGAQPLLRLDVKEGERDYLTDKKGEKVWRTKSTKAVMLCGAGKSGEVSCTPRIVLERSMEEESKGTPPKIAEQRSVELRDGKIVITEKGGNKIERPLVFR